MNNIVKYTKPYSVVARDSDFMQNIKLSSLFSYFEDIAGLHASELGIPRETLYEKHGCVWVVSRTKVEILKYPVWNDEVIFETWPQVPQRFQVDRDYYVKDKDGNILIKGSSIWVLIDYKTRHLVKTDILDDYSQGVVKERALESKLSQIRLKGEESTCYSRVIRNSDIDMNRHVNNAHYPDYVMDCYPIEFLKDHPVSSLQVNYLNEALEGEEIVFSKFISEDNPLKHYILGCSKVDNKQFFKAEIIFK